MKLIGTLAAAALCFFSAAAAGAAVTGTIIDENGAAVAGVAVRALAAESFREVVDRVAAGKLNPDPLANASSAENGSFRIELQSNTAVTIVFNAPGRQMVVVETVDGDDLGTILMRTAKPRRGRVLSGGKPVAGAAVLTATGAYATRTREDGTFEMPDAERAAVWVFHPDYTAEVDQLRGDSTDIRLARGTAIRGRVLGRDGKPVANAIIRSGTASAKSGEDGAFVLDHVSPRWRVALVTATGGVAVVTNSGAKSYDVKLRAGASLTGSVRDMKARTGVAGARVMLSGMNTGQVPDVAVTNTRGDFSYPNVPAGQYFIQVQHPNYYSADNQRITLDAGQKETRTVAATPLVKITGTVVDEERKPVAAATVSRFRAAAGLRESATGSDGRFVLKAGPDFRGEIEMQVMKSGFAPARHTVSAGPDAKPSPVSVTLRRGMPLTVRVVDGDRQPVANAEVNVSDATDDQEPPYVNYRPPLPCETRDCRTAADGTVLLRVVPGKFDFSVTSEVTPPKRLAAQTVGPKSSPLTITVERGVEISGRVVRSDGTPVSGVMISVSGRNSGRPAESDSSGAFHIYSAPRGDVTLTAAVTNPIQYQLPPKSVTAPATDVVITVPRTGSVSGRVVDAESMQPVTDFQIQAFRPMQMMGQVPVQSEDGTFTLREVPAGQFDLQVVANGYVRGTASDIVVEEAKATENVEIKLARAGKVVGHVTGPDGQGLSAVSVNYREAPQRGPRPGGFSAMTDANGDYELGSVPAGQQTILFYKNGYVNAEKSVDSTPGKETRLDVTMDRGREIRGRVVDETGKPVANANVMAEGPSGSSDRSDAEGNFQIAGLREGKYAVRARKQGFVEARVTDIDSAAPTSLSITMRRGGTLTGRVTGLREDELQRVNINVFGQGSNANGRPDSTGAFSISGVPDGKVSVEAMLGGPHMRRTPRKSVDVINGTAPSVELAFGEGFTITGRVTVRGTPLESGGVNFMPTDQSQSPASARIEANGAYVAEGLSAGEYRINVYSMNGGSIYNGRLTVAGNSAHDIDVRGAAVRGRVTDANGTPLPGVNVMLMSTGKGPGPGISPDTTDSAGRFAFNVVTEGTWRLRLQKEQYETHLQDLAVTEGMPEVQIQLKRGTPASVRVVDAVTGAPIVAMVNASDPSKPGASYSATARATDGVAELWLAPGHYTVRAMARGYAMATSGIDVPGPEVQVRLARGGTVIVTVGGLPANVRARLVALPPTTMNTATGNGRFEGVPAGQYNCMLLGPDGKTTQQKPVTVVAGQTVTVNFD